MKVGFKITADRIDVTHKIKSRLIELNLIDSTNINNDSVEITIDNRDQIVQIPNTGAELDIHIGYDNALVYKGTYTVDEISVPLEEDSFTIHAQATHMKKSFKSPRDASYSHISLTSLVEKIAKRHGYDSVVSDELKAIELEHIDQIGESDSNLLNRIARSQNASFKVAANKILILPRQRGRNASGIPLPIINISNPSSSQGRLTIQDSGVYNSVSARWYNNEQQTMQQEVVGQGDPQFVIRKIQTSQEAAISAASARLDEIKRGQMTLSLTRPLSTHIVAESFINIRNHKPPFNGIWLIEQVTHHIDSEQFATSVFDCSSSLKNA